VLDHIHAHQLDGTFHLPDINQTKPMGHPVHELDHRRKKTGVGGDRDPGDLFFWRCFHLGHKKFLFGTIVSIDTFIISGPVNFDQTDAVHARKADRLKC
jgi:hypothetical protein